MVITEAVRLDSTTFTTNPNINTVGARSMNNNIHRPVTSRANKAPIYTSDKRAKFAQRENKKWVRLATVVGYLISVCIPAIALSVYYVGFWDPDYKGRISNDSMPMRATTEFSCPPCECKFDKESDKKVRHTDLGSVVAGTIYKTLSSKDEASASTNDFDDYQSAFAAHEETVTYGQPSKSPKIYR